MPAFPCSGSLYSNTYVRFLDNAGFCWDISYSPKRIWCTQNSFADYLHRHESAIYGGSRKKIHPCSDEIRCISFITPGICKNQIRIIPLCNIAQIRCNINKWLAFPASYEISHIRKQGNRISHSRGREFEENLHSFRIERMRKNLCSLKENVYLPRYKILFERNENYTRHIFIKISFSTHRISDNNFERICT